MLGNLVKQLDRKGQQAAADKAKGPPTRPSSPPKPEGMTAIDLVNQAAAIVQAIEDRAAETLARAHDLAGQAAERLKFAESRIRALEASQSALEDSLHEANARADEAEQLVAQTAAELAAMETQLAAADQRAGYADARVIEAEKMLIRVEDAIQSQLIANRQPSMNRMAAAA